ncbi:autoinducer binding domain-containing protein [Jannaschia sp. Os4]|uniref:autoinducer binding domain-containing protein n=1 Tax=Jannaschia sp. Os4 TaxID=2807617 RepID=UPI00193ACABB|nr:autoinducer binding domain-containing protein [Jannaschia sp. Os4]MBM2577106.1 autoinducer binding domain-containing protein [Jannaschia sp. Os4]
MSERRRLMVQYCRELDALGPEGSIVGLHIRFAAPAFVRSTYPQEWKDTYLDRAYGMRDPLVLWGVANKGVSRWSEIGVPDPFGVLEEAAKHGLRYGAVASCGHITSRSMAGVARGDREFTTDEMAELERLTHALHELGEPLSDLPPDVLEALRLEARRRDGAAEAPGPEDLPAGHEGRLGDARDILGTRTTAEAIRMARYHRLI